MIVLINGAFGVGKTTTAQLLTRELADPNTIRIQLAASPQTLRSRIVNRPEAEGPRAWALAHLESGLALAANDEYGYVIDTDSLSLSLSLSLSPEEVADAVTAVIDRQPAWS
jgi:hypothetical protein